LLLLIQHKARSVKGSHIKGDRKTYLISSD
jgi:hypothetical protein